MVLQHFSEMLSTRPFQLSFVTSLAVCFCINYLFEWGNMSKWGQLHYSEMATLLHSGQEALVKHLIARSPPGAA